MTSKLNYNFSFPFNYKFIRFSRFNPFRLSTIDSSIVIAYKFEFSIFSNISSL